MLLRGGMLLLVLCSRTARSFHAHSSSLRSFNSPASSCRPPSLHRVLPPLPRQATLRSHVRMMPEGPEVRTIVNQLSASVASKYRLCDIRILSGRYTRHGAPPGYDEFMGRLRAEGPAGDANVIEAWDCKGKFQFFRLQGERSCWITLGMSGRFVWDDTAHKHARLCFDLEELCTGEQRPLLFLDQRNFGTVHFCLSDAGLQKKLSTIGPDLLDPSSLTAEGFVEIARGQRNPGMNICKFLMNQQKISGIGNYLLSEGLYKSGMDPWATLQDLSDHDLSALFEHTRATAQSSLEAQGVTRRGGSYRSVTGEKGQFEFELECYGRQVTLQNERVNKVVDGPHGRSIWFVDSQIARNSLKPDS